MTQADLPFDSWDRLSEPDSCDCGCHHADGLDVPVFSPVPDPDRELWWRDGTMCCDCWTLGKLTRKVRWLSDKVSDARGLPSNWVYDRPGDRDDQADQADQAADDAEAAEAWQSLTDAVRKAAEAGDADQADQADQVGANEGVFGNSDGDAWWSCKVLSGEVESLWDCICPECMSIKWE